MPFQVGPAELIVVLVVALLVLGPKKLPEVGRSLGNGIRGFKDSMSGHEEPEHAQITEPTNQAKPAKTSPEANVTGDPPSAKETQPPR